MFRPSPRPCGRRDWPGDASRFRPPGDGHRVVHGGPDYVRPVLIDTTVLDVCQVIRTSHRCTSPTISRRSGSLWEIKPDVPQVACFDTGFHRGRAGAYRLLCPAARLLLSRVCALWLSMDLL
ncbi:hypothetical protein F2981_22625 (plasmid) [Sinorhizobium meliloti]|nr:hypothetical protein [Sinorhizobium meliloti]